MKKSKSKLDEQEPKKPVVRVFEAILKEEKKQHPLAVKLLKLAEKYGMTPGAIHRRPILLAEMGLEQDDFTTEDIQTADSIADRWGREFQRRLWEYNFKNNPTSAETEKPTKREPKEKETKADKQKEPSKGDVFGKYKATAFVRWMGVNGMSFQSAQGVLQTLGIDLADSTIKIQLVAGKKGERGEPAQLTEEEEEKTFEMALKAVKKSKK